MHVATSVVSTLIMFVALSSAVFADNRAYVTYAKGDITHRQPELIRNPPPKGAEVFAGDIFKTGENGFVSLHLASGAMINIQPESEVTVLDIQCQDPLSECVISVQADKGELESQITPRDEHEQAIKFRVDAPFLSAAVRGTAFYISVDSDVNKIGITEGLVATDAQGGTYDLPEGKGLMVSAAQSLKSITLVPAPVLALVADQLIISSEDSLVWGEVPGAVAYQVEVARDGLFSRPVLFEKTHKTQAELPIESVGTYHLKVAGIDADQFSGMPVKMQFSYAHITEDQPLDLEILRDGSAVNIRTDYEGQIELVISSDLSSSSSSTRTLFSDLSNGIRLQLSKDQDWVIKARKVISDNAVSKYSVQYLLKLDR